MVAPQPGPQAKLLSCPCEEVFFGGARGGGKSYGSLLDFLAHHGEHRGGTKGILLRRTLPELEDMQEKAERLLPQLGWQYRVQQKTWLHASGSSLKMRYLERDSHAQRYQGHEYNWMDFDEVTNWPSPDPIDKMRATLRAPGRKRMVLTGNPGGPGHNWVRRRYIDPAPPMTPVQVRPGWSRVYIPSKVQDNPALLAENPHYVEQLRDTGPEWLVRAWLEGDWNIVAGGMFDDVWNEELHVVEPFPVPDTWRVRRAFDWGSSKPFSVGWWAEADGEDHPGVPRRYPRGTQVRIAEWYGWNGNPNEGLKMTAAEIGRRIVAMERQMGLQVHPGPADSAIFAVENGRSIAADMESVGVRWEQAQKGPGSRVQGWERMRAMLRATMQRPMEEPGLVVFSTCRQWIRTVPMLPRDDRVPDDVDTDAEDHAGDETRYLVMTPDRTARRVRTKGV